MNNGRIHAAVELTSGDAIRLHSLDAAALRFSFVDDSETDTLGWTNRVNGMQPAAGWLPPGSPTARRSLSRRRSLSNDRLARVREQRSDGVAAVLQYAALVPPHAVLPTGAEARRAQALTIPAGAPTVRDDVFSAPARWPSASSLLHHQARGTLAYARMPHSPSMPLKRPAPAAVDAVNVLGSSASRERYRNPSRPYLSVAMPPWRRSGGGDNGGGSISAALRSRHDSDVFDVPVSIVTPARRLRVNNTNGDGSGSADTITTASQMHESGSLWLREPCAGESRYIDFAVESGADISGRRLHNSSEHARESPRHVAASTVRTVVEMPGMPTARRIAEELMDAERYADEATPLPPRGADDRGSNAVDARVRRHHGDASESRRVHSARTGNKSRDTAGSTGQGIRRRSPARRNSDGGASAATHLEMSSSESSSHEQELLKPEVDSPRCQERRAVHVTASARNPSTPASDMHVVTIKEKRTLGAQLSRVEALLSEKLAGKNSADNVIYDRPPRRHRRNLLGGSTAENKAEYKPCHRYGSNDSDTSASDNDDISGAQMPYPPSGQSDARTAGDVPALRELLRVRGEQARLLLYSADAAVVRLATATASSARKSDRERCGAQGLPTTTMRSNVRSGQLAERFAAISRDDGAGSVVLSGGVVIGDDSVTATQLRVAPGRPSTSDALAFADASTITSKVGSPIERAQPGGILPLPTPRRTTDSPRTTALPIHAEALDHGDSQRRVLTALEHRDTVDSGCSPMRHDPVHAPTHRGAPSPLFPERAIQPSSSSTAYRLAALLGRSAPVVTPPLVHVPRTLGGPSSRAARGLAKTPTAKLWMAPHMLPLPLLPQPLLTFH